MILKLLNKIIYTLLIAVFILTISCSEDGTDDSDILINYNDTALVNPYEKFEPADGKVLVFAGQTLTAIGGLDEYTDGYVEHFKTPAGVTGYTDLPRLAGLTTTENWGADDNNLQLYIDDEDFNNTCIAIGLHIVDQLEDIDAGNHDDAIRELAEWCISLNDRPVFLRIGYEFDGSWNHYDPLLYKKSFKRIKDIMTQQGAYNVVYVWQSATYRDASKKVFDDYYPGDTYVDWCGLSFFFTPDMANLMVEYAREKDKPVFIAESAPFLVDLDGDPLPTEIAVDSVAMELWEEWFPPYFSLIEDNPDVVKAFSYINHDWRGEPLWGGNNPFFYLDSRLHANEFLKGKWTGKMNEDRYIHASDTLFLYLNNRVNVEKGL